MLCIQHDFEYLSSIEDFNRAIEIGSVSSVVSIGKFPLYQ